MSRRVVVCRARRPWPGASAGDLVLLTDAGLVLEPDFYLCAASMVGRNLVHEVGEAFLKSAAASSSCAWWRGRAESLRNPMRRNSRLSVCLEIETWNSSKTHCATSIRRQRTTPWTEGIGPSSTACRRALALVLVEKARCSWGLAGQEPIGTLGVEPDNPVAHDLQGDAADQSCVRPRAAVIDLRQGDEAPRLVGVSRAPRQLA
jgi:hypothetical protein